jgi:hypothetical protein
MIKQQIFDDVIFSDMQNFVLLGVFLPPITAFNGQYFNMTLAS